ncbi:MAG: Rpn family recombination-promoting nuclease/putative transposase (plasmid) [Candidatus Symbiodolus clandestinus]
MLESDCVCRCQIRGEDGYIIIGTEHQSQDEALMALRTLRYEVGIMHNHTRNGHKKLPIVISLVLYHGTKSPYPHSTEIWDCFEQPELAKQWALRPFHLIDLTVMADEQIQQFHSAAMMGLLFKHYREERFSWLQKMFENGVFAIILAEIGKDYLEDSGEYIFKACQGGLSKKERYKALEIFKLVDPEVGEKVMTLAEHFKAEGEQKGLQQGIQQGKERGEQDKAIEIAKKMLEARVALQTIKNCTGLSDQEIASLSLH